MSGTRSPSPTAPATDPREVVLIAFGSLSDPSPQDAAIAALAEEVAAERPGWRVRGATMAAEGSIAAAFDGLGPGAEVFPLLMSDGWLLRRVLRDALAAVGRGDAPPRTPIGLMPSFHAHCAGLIRDGLAQAGLAAADTTVVLAAHGSARGPRPAACARALCDELLRRTGVRAVVPGYLEEAPFLADALAAAPAPALCLPCFMTNAFHATSDVPGAVAESGFAGPVLAAAGTAPGIAALIADALAVAAPGTRAA
ncbi:cobalamin biosynthesis protein CbiX [Rhodobacteraceae bacterium CCMM004]|nr:cobalamin biosynthesis protein CbiX [Rhodobacteraceae bacterium CCMM004]